MSIERVVSKATSATSIESLFADLVQEASVRGFDYVAYKNNCHFDGENIDFVSSVKSNYPSAWQDHYIENRYHLLDPVIAAAKKLEEPFDWLLLPRGKECGPSQTRVLSEAAEFGLRCGVSVPIHGAGERVAFVSFASKDVHDFSSNEIAIIQLIATNFNHNFNRITKSRHDTKEYFRLTSRERECLSWVALGKSSRDIGDIIGLSENTVTFHIKNSMKKIDTTNRNVAASIAARAGLL